MLRPVGKHNFFFSVSAFLKSKLLLILTHKGTRRWVIVSCSRLASHRTMLVTYTFQGHAFPPRRWMKTPGRWVLMTQRWAIFGHFRAIEEEGAFTPDSVLFCSASFRCFSCSSFCDHRAHRLFNWQKMSVFNTLECASASSGSFFFFFSFKYFPLDLTVPWGVLKKIS